MRQEERFWTAGIICHLYGAAIAKALGIFDAPIASDITWLKATLVGMRDNVDEMTQNVNDPLTQFVQSNFRNILRIGRDSAGKEIILDIDRVASPIRGRFDTETGTLWIPKRDFKAFAKENSLAADSLDKFAVEDIELLNGLLKNMASKKVACYRIEKHDSYIGNGLSVGGSGSDEPPTSVVAD
jgi:hypothetical protein